MLTLFGGHGDPVALIVVCVVLIAAPSVGTWLWWRRIEDGCASWPQALSAARRELRLGILAAAILTASFVYVSYVALWGEYVGVFGMSLSAGHVVAALPLLALGAALALQTLGERLWPTPSGRRRDAHLVAREPATFLDTRTTTRAFAVLTATVLGLTLAASGARAVSKIQGRLAETITPFPGWLWALPILSAAGLAALLLRRAVRSVAERAAVPDVTSAWDAWLRRQAAQRLAQTTIVICGLTTAGVLTVAGSSIHLLGRGFGAGAASGTPSDLYQVAGVGLQILAVVAVAGAVLAATRHVVDVAPEPAATVSSVAGTS